MKEFKTGKNPILIATDVAARGLGMYSPPSVSFLESRSRVVSN